MRLETSWLLVLAAGILLIPLNVKATEVDSVSLQSGESTNNPGGQAGNASKADTGKKSHKTSAKAHKGGKKSKKSASGTATPPPK